MSEESTPIKRRRRNELGPSLHGERYSKETLDGGLRYQNLIEKTPDKIRYESKTNRQKQQTYWADVAQSSSSSFHTPVISGREPVHDSSNGFYAKRRDAVCILFQMMGSPEEFYWEEEGIVSDIMNRLMINHNSRSSVITILQDVLIAEEQELIYDPNTNLRKRGRKMSITDFDANAVSLYHSLATGCGVPAAADILNLSLNAAASILLDIQYWGCEVN